MQTQTPLIDRLIKAIEESKTEFTCCKETDTEFEVFGSKHTTDELIELVNKQLGVSSKCANSLNAYLWYTCNHIVIMSQHDWYFEIVKVD